MTDKSRVYVALLRGINVGGHTTVSMTELKVAFTDLGFIGVKTYINSGNVIFRSDENDPRALESRIEPVLEKKFSYSIKVVVRSIDEMQQVIQQIPKKWFDNKEQRSMVMFLRHSIDNPGILSEINAKREIEKLSYYPGLLLWSVKFDDLSKSSVLKINQSKLYKDMTVRNLNTTRKIYELMQAVEFS